MSSETTAGRQVISVEAHAWTAELRDALLRSPRR